MSDFKRLLVKTKLSNRDAAIIFEVSDRTVRRWNSGSAKPPQFVMTILDKHPQLIEEFKGGRNE
ncbi:MAG: hypothetical protein P8I94_03325 [Emcibacteraceae bacterium]|nr:hypothetical protein [Emcibacteraceae bacterium]